MNYIKTCIKAACDVLSCKNLDNKNDISDDSPCFEKEKSMAKIRRTVMLNGVQVWIQANSEQEYADKLLRLSAPEQPSDPKEPHNFTEYANAWFETYSKPNIETATQKTYRRQLDLYLIPAFGDKNIEDLTTQDTQRMFNSMKGTKSTKMKAKTVLNMIFEAALDDDLIKRNPLKSKKLKITGSDSKVTEVYSIEQMKMLIRSIPNVSKADDRTYLALQALHPMRLEEVLGLKWKDIDFNTMTIHIQRAVTHPTRNQPEVKETKTEASKRTIGLSSISAQYLSPGDPEDYILGGKAPYSYQKVKRACERIQQDIGFEERITPIRFRTTVLTDIYAQTKDVTITQAAAGHTTAAMTLKHYVKGRDRLDKSSSAIDSIYGE